MGQPNPWTTLHCPHSTRSIEEGTYVTVRCPSVRLSGLDLNEAKHDKRFGWQGHQLDRMQTICTLLQTDNHTNTSSLNFYRPHALPGKINYFIIAESLVNVSAKNYKNLTILTRVTAKNVGDPFYGTRCINAFSVRVLLMC